MNHLLERCPILRGLVMLVSLRRRAQAFRSRVRGPHHGTEETVRRPDRLLHHRRAFDEVDDRERYQDQRGRVTRAWPSVSIGAHHRTAGGRRAVMKHRATQPCLRHGRLRLGVGGEFRPKAVSGARSESVETRSERFHSAHRARYQARISPTTKSPAAAVASGPSSRCGRRAWSADTSPRSSPCSPIARSAAPPSARA